MATRPARLSRREREAMDIIHQHGQATAAEVRVAMPSPPTDAAVRATLRILVEKGHLRFEQDGPRYLYSPTESPEMARRSALEHLLDTFFAGSTEGALATLLEMQAGALSEPERARLKRMIDAAAEAGR